MLLPVVAQPRLQVLIAVLANQVSVEVFLTSFRWGVLFGIDSVELNDGERIRLNLWTARSLTQPGSGDSSSRKGRHEDHKSEDTEKLLGKVFGF